jgi:hypothetical protein
MGMATCSDAEALPTRRPLNRRRLHRATAAVLIALALGAAAPARAADDAQAAAARASLERLRALRLERPGDGLLAYYQALMHATLGERDAAIEALRGLRGRALGLIPARGLGFDPLWNDPAFSELRQELAAGEPRTADAPVAFRLDDDRLVPEGIAFDPVARRFFVGSIARHAIVASGDRTRWRDWSRPEDGLDAVLGLAVDAGRRALYAVSTNAFEDAGRTSLRNALVRYDLDTGRLVARIDVPQARQLNDVAVAADGTLYVTDSAAGAVFRLPSGGEELVSFVAAGRAPGANGIAVARDGTVYVTLSTGIGRIEPGDGSLLRLPQPDTVVTGGIDGLYWHDGDLIAVQNVTNPGRVIRIRLAADGRQVTGVAVLQSHHHPELEEPTTGVIVGDALHLLANTHVRRYRPDGTLHDVGTMRPAAVLAVPLRPSV